MVLVTLQDMGRNAGLNKENEDGNSQQSSDAETADKMEAPIRFTDLYKVSKESSAQLCSVFRLKIKIVFFSGFVPTST